MKTINQLCAFLENRPGQLAEILGVLSGNEVNLRALNVAETTNYGVVRFIADDHMKAWNILKSEGYTVSKNPVFAITVPDRPGGLKALLDKLAADGVDIEYMYSVFSFKSGAAYMVVNAKNMDVMAASLEKNHIEAADNEQLGLK